MSRIVWIVALCLALQLPARAAQFTVGITSSDDAQLANPVARDQPLSADQILDMTRHAMERIGGMASVVPDTARLVLIKPNISIARSSGTGVVTDTRVVRAVALLVHDVAPDAKILIGEGAGGWISPALADCSVVHVGSGRALSEVAHDGFAIAGHRTTVEELRALGIDIDVHDLNFDEGRTLSVPGGGLLWDEYKIASTVIDADVWINVPVAKTHGSKITCCLKNHYGIFPGSVYGWNKARGTPTHRGIPHWPRTLDESWIDLVLLTQVDLNVVDMIQGTEGGAFQGDPKRSNLIVAGVDPIATDLVVAQLMGFNPDDFEYAYLGATRGLGPGSIENVQVVGGNPAALSSRFAKAGIDNDGDWGEHAQYGMGPRHWTLLGPLDRDHRFDESEIASLSPIPGQDGWSDVVWFGFDKIDLDTHFDDPVRKAVYAFTHFTMASSDSVRFWLGSDEGLSVWIDGEQIYHHEGRRRHVLGGDRVPGFIEAGEHRLLIRAEQGRGPFDFSINICEPIDDILYAGNRYPGLRYYQADHAEAHPAMQVHARQGWSPDRIGGYESTMSLDFDPLDAYVEAPDSGHVYVVQAVSTSLLEVIATQHPSVRVWSDTSMATALSRLPFSFSWILPGDERYTPDQSVDLGRVLSWFGLDYWLAWGSGRAETAKAIAGWLAHGYTPLSGYSDGWDQVFAYRKQTDGPLLLRSVRPDTALWHDYSRGGWGRLPGPAWLEQALLVVKPNGPPISFDAMIDSVATVALQLARTPRIEFDDDWGAKGNPAGLHAWDVAVWDWERLPWTTQWAGEEGRDLLGRMARGEYANVAQDRHMAGQLFANAAQASSADRRQLLATASTAYGKLAQTLVRMHDGFPTSRSGAVSPEDSLRHIHIGDLQPLMRQARELERRALQALVDLLGDRPLPAAQEDPLRRRDQGRMLFAWSSSFSKGIYDLTLHGREVSRELRWGRDAEGEVVDVQNEVHRKAGWQVALEVRTGTGYYEVLQQPSADNDWTAVLRVDDEHTDLDNITEIVVWEVPVQQAAPR